MRNAELRAPSTRIGRIEELAPTGLSRIPFHAEMVASYTVSRRLVNWISASHLFAPELRRSGFDRQILASVSQQARYLARNLERDVRGNHLLANLRALICCGEFLAGREAPLWKRESLQHLRREVAEQILPDGGHFERNPGYHLVVLQDSSILHVTAPVRARAARLADACAGKDVGYLIVILPPSGDCRCSGHAWARFPSPKPSLHWHPSVGRPTLEAVRIVSPICGSRGW